MTSPCNASFTFATSPQPACLLCMFYVCVCISAILSPSKLRKQLTISCAFQANNSAVFPPTPSSQINMTSCCVRLHFTSLSSFRASFQIPLTPSSAPSLCHTRITLISTWTKQHLRLRQSEWVRTVRIQTQNPSKFDRISLKPGSGLKAQLGNISYQSSCTQSCIVNYCGFFLSKFVFFL